MRKKELSLFPPSPHRYTGDELAALVVEPPRSADGPLHRGVRPNSSGKAGQGKAPSISN